MKIPLAYRNTEYDGVTYLIGYDSSGDLNEVYSTSDIIDHLAAPVMTALKNAAENAIIEDADYMFKSESEGNL